MNKLFLVVAASLLLAGCSKKEGLQQQPEVFAPVHTYKPDVGRFHK